MELKTMLFSYSKLLRRTDINVYNKKTIVIIITNYRLSSKRPLECEVPFLQLIAMII